MNLSELKAALDKQISELAEDVRQKHIELGMSMGRYQHALEVRQAIDQPAGEGNTAGGDEPPAIALPQLLEDADAPQPIQTK